MRIGSGRHYPGIWLERMRKIMNILSWFECLYPGIQDRDATACARLPLLTLNAICRRLACRDTVTNTEITLEYRTETLLLVPDWLLALNAICRRLAYRDTVTNTEIRLSQARLVFIIGSCILFFLVSSVSDMGSKQPSMQWVQGLIPRV
jgi:hypothetical protein